MAEFTFEGKTVYYELYGQGGTPLIILNGIMMSTASWKPFIETFSAKNTLVLVDFFDQGKSQRMTKKYDHSLQVQLLNELIERLWYSQVTIMGISYGGEIALQYALQHPARVKRLILSNTAARTSAWLKEIGHGWNAVAETGDGRAYYLTTIPGIYSTGFFRDKQQWMQNREKYLVEYFSNPEVLKSLIRLTDSSENYDVSDRLEEIKCPTLIISGSEDTLTPMCEQRLLHEKITGSRWATINGSGHATMYEQPSLFATLVLGFVNLPDDEIII